MTIEAKLRRIKILRYLVLSRWFFHAGIVALGLLQKALGVAQFNPETFLLILVTYTYNLLFYLYLRRDPKKLSERGLRFVSVLQLVLDQLVVTMVVYATGGVESLSFLFYFTSILMAIVIFRARGIILLTLFTLLLYISVITLEYHQLIAHIPRYAFDPGFYGNLRVTIHNTLTVAYIFIITTFFAAFISRIIHLQEELAIAERDKVVTLFNNLIDGVILFDHYDKVLLMNPYAKTILGVKSAHVIDHVLRPQDFSMDLQLLVQFMINGIAARKYQTTEICVTHQDDHIVLQTTVLQVMDADGRAVGGLVVMHNITREKDLDQVKSDFISIAAHQLRTPLATLKWLFKLLLDGDGGKLTAKQQELMRKGYERNDEVIEIVNNLLDISEIEEGRFEYHFVSRSLVELVQQAIDASHINAQRTGITIQFTADPDLPTVQIDRQKMKMAIQNLIDNAIKYSHPQGAITVLLQGLDHSVELVVKDHGIGMSTETKEKLFVKFYRGKEAVTKEPTGSGLGLYIVKNIIEKHHGTIGFTSTIGQGTTFYVRLPIAQ